MTRLDEELCGGIPEQSLVALKGLPGTGKTTLAYRFLEEGLLDGEVAVWFSLNESKLQTLSNAYPFTKFSVTSFDGYLAKIRQLEDAGKLKIIDVVAATPKGQPAFTQELIEAVQRLTPRRLVVDSYSTLFTGRVAKSEERTALQVTFSKVISSRGCTTMLTVESDSEQQIDYAADIVISLERQLVDGRSRRLLTINKRRGAKTIRPTSLFTLSDGLKVFGPYREPEANSNKFKPIRLDGGLYSTGVAQLDDLLGGVSLGTIIFLEIGPDIRVETMQLIPLTMKLNFLAVGGRLAFWPLAGANAAAFRAFAGQSLDVELPRVARVMEYGKVTDEIGVKVNGIFEADNTAWCSTVSGLGEDGSPVLKAYNVENFEYRYSSEDTLRFIANDMIDTISSPRICIVVGKPWLRLNAAFANHAYIHLELFSVHGTPVLRGRRPWTPEFVVEADYSVNPIGVRLTELS